MSRQGQSVQPQALSSTAARIFISTGEVSGDLQGALLIDALKRQSACQGISLEILALGGDRMAQAGATLLGHTSGIGSVGIFESLPFVVPTLLLQRRVKRILQQHPPDLVVMIDYLGPNLSIGSFVRSQLSSVPMVYYIAPQEWVWSFSGQNTERIATMTNHLLAIFPEEARYYAERGATVTWVGHPLVDRMQTAPSREQARSQLGIGDNQLAIALLPASRRQELKYLLPIIFAAARQIQNQLPDVKFWIPLSLPAYRPAIEQAIQTYGLHATLLENQSQAVIAAADVAIAKSGTVNLETALMNVPQVVLYRVNPVTAWIAKRVLNFSIPFMSPPNLVEMKPIVPEFLQDQATPAAIAQATLDLLPGQPRRAQMLSDYQTMRQTLGEPGVCDRAAKAILELLVSKTPAT